MRGWLFWTVAFGAIMGVALYYASSAHADPDAVPYAVCAELGSNPTIFTVSRVLDEVASVGLTGKQAADVVVEAVESTCPEYLPLLRKFVQTYAPQQQESAIA